MDEEKRKRLHSNLLEKETPSQVSRFVMKRRQMTAGFDERQKQLFNEALIAILTAGMPDDELLEVLTAAYDTTIHVFSGQMLAETWLPNAVCNPSAPDRLSPADSALPALLSCTSCYGYNLRLRGKLVQCDGCGTVQPVIIDRPRVVKDGVVEQELAARYFATGDEPMTALREENRKLEKEEGEGESHKRDPHVEWPRKGNEPDNARRGVEPTIRSVSGRIPHSITKPILLAGNCQSFHTERWKSLCSVSNTSGISRVTAAMIFAPCKRIRLLVATCRPD